MPVTRRKLVATSGARRSRSSPSRSPNQVRREWPWLVGPLLAALILRAWAAAANSGMTMDSSLYVSMAEALARGSAEDLGPAHHGYPALVALVSFFLPGREWPARVVSMVAGMALVTLVYRLARVRLAPGWSSVAAALVALHPLLVAYSAAIMSESLFLMLVVLALLLIERRRFLYGGLVLGAGYVVRPESAVIAGVAALTRRGGWRGGLLLLLGALLAVAPYLVWLRVERGTWMLTPKTTLVRPQFESPRGAEWRLRDEDARQREPQDLMGRLSWAAPSVAASYLPLLGQHARLLHQAWPLPLLILSVAGLATWRGAILAPLPFFFVLPFLAIPLDVRFMQVFLPTLAVGAAAGCAAINVRAQKLAPVGIGLALLLAATGTVWCWTGAAGERARKFDDGPMQPLRAAGYWLRANGRSNAVVMDRKAYVPFFAEMKQVQLPDDEYNAIVEYARKSGVDYIVLEEYASNLRRQMVRLVADPDFQAQEHRLRLVYFRRDEPHTGVAIFEVVRDSIPVSAR